MAVMSALIRKSTPLPTIARALERRYPGVSVKCCEARVNDDGTEGVVYGFSAKADLLIRYGLAKRGQRDELKATAGDSETVGSGTDCRGDSTYVYHWMSADEPRVIHGRTYPLKKTVQEFERIWKRISRPLPARAAS
jgi:hypothetical protein